MTGAGVPRINRRTGGFVGGVRTNFGSFPSFSHPERLANSEVSVFQVHDADDDEGDKNYLLPRDPNDRGTEGEFTSPIAS